MNSLHEKLTAKEAIKRRCADCYGGKCTDDRCPLYGLPKKAGRLPDGKQAIRHYCGWCMNGNQVRECTCTNCSIFQYRSEKHTDVHIDFAVKKAGYTHTGSEAKRKVDIDDHPAKQTLKKRALSQGDAL
ncbi:hypothetical protein [Treponema endosymbiont of Eucomonympha sp.]|uniref:hypothetical protein n=1 Tax=Treponema endosymbiont of Eucomonympha sp. TaxID=1580831 RepID=UPI000784B1F6|nr:hypothetical protein [Treponema endosymbiont of Eucomonympha sp.]